MAYALTLLELHFVATWSRLRAQMFHTWMLTGSLMWDGPMSALALLDDYFSGEITRRNALAVVSLMLLSGCLFGAAMWAWDEIRYRRLLGMVRNSGMR